MIPKFKELQVVKSIKAFESIPTGTIGTILIIYFTEQTIAYEVEFIDDFGHFYETLAIPEGYLTCVV